MSTIPLSLKSYRSFSSDGSSAVCPGAPMMDQDVPSSQGYRERFNQVAKEMGLDYFAYVTDQEGGGTNIPDLYINGALSDEIRIDARRYAEITGEKSPNLLLLTTLAVASASEDICVVVKAVEDQRKEAVDFSVRKAVKVVPNNTNKTLLTEAEQLWTGTLLVDMAHLADEIFGAQSSLYHEQYSQYVGDCGDRASRVSFGFSKDPLGFFIKPYQSEKAGYSVGERSNNLPYYPQNTASQGSAMWPSDLTNAELTYIKENYPETDPIMAPYTVVERLHDPARGQEVIMNSSGIEVQWVREGLNGSRYLVTNMIWHQRFSSYYKMLADKLRASASLKTPSGEGLPLALTQYLTNIANSIDRCDFTAWLKFDMQQRAEDGNIYFTMFPHEAYWPDGVKYGFMLNAGIRDQALLKELSAYAETVPDLAEDLARIYKHSGHQLAKPTTHTTLLLEYIRTLAAGGMLQNFRASGEPFGHDYPKVTQIYEETGMGAHRVVTMQDIIEAQTNKRELFGAVFGSAYDPWVTESMKALFVFGHEVTHGLGLRPSDRLSNGKIYSDAFSGNSFALLNEPQADLGSIVLIMKRHKQGAMTDADYQSALVTFVYHQITRALVKDQTQDSEYQAGAPHWCGAAMIMGHLYTQGAFALQSDGHYAIDYDKLETGLLDLWERLNVLAVNGDAAEFMKFFMTAVDAMPDDMINKKSHVETGWSYSQWVISRGKEDCGDIQDYQSHE